MSGDLSEPHRVPGCELDQFEDDSLIQSTLPKTELKNGKIICDGPTQLPLSQQIKSGEENVNFLKTNQAAKSARNGEDKFMVSDLDFIHPPPYEEEDHSCSSGSSTVSEDMSFSDSGDSVEVPEFMDATEHKSEKLSAAMNEVVTGIQLHTFYTPEKSCGENIAIHQACPEQQQQVPNSSAGCGPPLVTPNKWPLESSLPDQHNHHQLQKTPEEDEYATIFQTLSVDEGNPAKDIMRIDSLPVPQQGDSRQGNLVIGLSQLPTNLEPALVSPDIILEPNHFLEKGVSIMGKSLNPIVTSLHNDPGSKVNFSVRTKTGKQKTQKGCHVYRTRDIPVSNPSNNHKYPEAFDGRILLRHIRKHAPDYASFLDIRGSSNDLKTPIDVILGMIPRRLNPSLTTAALGHSLYYMESFLEIFDRGLESAGKHALAVHVKEGINELKYVRNTANQARRLSLELAK